jgi:hypothetical protein
VEATRLCEEQGMTFIHPFDDALVMAGQGTIGLELLEQIGRPGSGGGADRRGRVDWRHCLRGEGDQAERARDRRADSAAAFDADASTLIIR